LRSAKGKTLTPGEAFALPGSYVGIASIVNRTMYFGSLGKILSSPDNVDCKLGATVWVYVSILRSIDTDCGYSADPAVEGEQPRLRPVLVI